MEEIVLMPLEVPASPKVRTTEYTNFRGVDFTNDSTNVWYRRSPDAVNMLPDDSGRPFKRTGWEVVVTAEQLATEVSVTVDELEILKCYYFELAGLDHIIIFTNKGLFVYKQEETLDDENNVVYIDSYELLAPANGYSGDSRDEDCYLGFERAFFFEGNGVAAFYVYGNQKVWVYGYENGSFYFKRATDGFDVGQITIPRVLITTNPSDCTGVLYEGYNLLNERACAEYQGNDMFYAYSTGDFSVSADKATFTTALANLNKYTFTYDDTSTKWTLTYGTTTVSNLTTLDLDTTYGITISADPDDDDTIVVLYICGILLPNNVAQRQLNDVKVYGTAVTQFDVPYEVVGYSTTPTGKQCALFTDVYSSADNKRAWLEFNTSELKTTDSSEDIFRVIFPTKRVEITTYPDDLLPADVGEVTKTGAAVVNT